MTTLVPYRIVIPSRARAANMPAMARMFPDAYISIDESEMAAYTPPLDAPVGWRLMPHPPLPTIGAIRQWIREHTPEPALIMANDDVKHLVMLVGRSTRRTRDPQAVRQVIENAINIACDLGVSLVSWSRIADPKFFYGFDPINFVAPACAVFGVIRHEGREPQLTFDRRLANGEDLDLTLQALLHDRIAYQDRRFYFDCGQVYTGEGGLQGIRTSASRERDLAILNRRWGAHVHIGKPRDWSHQTARTDALRVVVTRRNGRATG